MTTDRSPRTLSILAVCTAALLAAWSAQAGTQAAAQDAPQADPPTLEVEPVEWPVRGGGVAPNLNPGADGSLWASWMSETDAGMTLAAVPWTGEGWGDVERIGSSNDWAVFPIDAPSLAVTDSGAMAAVHLAKAERGSNVVVHWKPAGGEWHAEGAVIHRDPTLGEHAFTSLVALDDDTFGVAWLDPRNHAKEGMGQSLMWSTFTADGVLGEEVLVDGRTCDCCPTDALVLEDGTVLAAWRDRSADEVRDMYAARFDGESWTDPARIHADEWEIHGCPVNGPTLAASGDRVAVSWFTLKDGETPRIHLALSEDGGRTFGPPVQVDDGDPTGRSDVAFLPDGSLAVVWLEKVAGGTRGSLRIRRFTLDVDIGGVNLLAEPAATLGPMALHPRSGRPSLAPVDGGLLCIWTKGERPRFRPAVARIRVAGD